MAGERKTQTQSIMSKIWWLKFNLIGAEMNAGTTFDPDITVNESSDNLAYRYGTNGQSHVILAVNIANRSNGGKNIIAEFTLPDGIDVTSIEVLHENRTIPVFQGKFTDLFNPFAVHIYRFYFIAAL